MKLPLPEGARRWPLGAEGQQPGDDSAESSGAVPATEEASEKPTNQKSRRRRLWGIASWVIYVGVIVLVIVFTPSILSRVLDTPYPMAAVTSSSMWPTLKKGDLVFLKGVDKPEELEVGDIIGFELDDGGFAIHRIIEIEGDRITTKGDGNQTADPVISFDRVIGYVPKIGGRLAKVPYLGNLGLLLGPIFGGKTSDDGTLGKPVFEGEPGQQEQPSGSEAGGTINLPGQ
jgi:signal peptidase I